MSGIVARLGARLLPAPDYCGDFAQRRLLPGVRLVCVGERRYIDIPRLRVWKRISGDSE